MLALVQRLRFGTQIGADSERLYWAMTGVAVALLPHLWLVPKWILLFIAVVSLWRIAIEVRTWPLPPRWLRIVIALATMTGVAATFRTLNGLEAGTALLVAMASIKLLETRGTRDCAMLIFIGYVLLFAALLYDQSLARLPYLFASAWLLTAAMLRLHQSSKPMRARTVMFTTGKIVLQAVPIAAVLFLFFPRLPGQFWALPSRESATTGLSDEMTPGDISNLIRSREPAFRVKFDGTPPPSAERYWRGPVLHEFDGRRWRREVLRSMEPQGVVGDGPSFKYRITIEPTQRPWLFALDAPTSWPNQAMRLYDFQLIARRPITTLTSFDLESNTRFQTALEMSPKMFALDTALPGDANPRSRAFAKELRASSGSDRAFIQAVLRKFRQEEYFYTLSPPLLGDNSVDEFLFATRRGFCEHFASAFTMLMRAANIPARVVTGYQGGEYNTLGEYLLIRQSDAHAWSEVWLEGRGWVRFDPTSAVAPQRIEGDLDSAISSSESMPGRFFRQNFFLSRARLTWDAVNNFWNNSVIQYNQQKQRSFMAMLGIDNADWRDLGVAFAVSLTLFFVALTLYLGRQYRPHRRDGAAIAYEQLCRKLAGLKLQRESHEGPVDYLSRVELSRPEIANEVKELRDLYTRLRYGPSAAPGELKRLKRLVRRLAA